LSNNTTPAESALELIGRFVDEGSFSPQNAGVGAVLTGTARVNGRPLALIAHDRGSRAASAAHYVSKIIALQEYVWKRPCPILYLFDEAIVAHLQTVFAGKRGIGSTYFHAARLAGRVPQVGVLMRSAFDAQSFLPSLCDALVVVDGVRIGLADPGWMPMLTGAVVDAAQYGDPIVSGLAHGAAKDTSEAIGWALRYLSYLPDHVSAPNRRVGACEPECSGLTLEEIVPTESTQPFDMTLLLREVIDAGSLHEMRAEFAPEMITAFARIDGRAIGIVANNSRYRGGLLFPEGCEKSATFVELCTRFGIPLLFFVDTPGFMPGDQMERRGSLRAASRLYRALANATVPRITVIARKAHSAGLYAMCGPPFRPDACIALPTAVVSVFGKKLALQLEKHLSREAGSSSAFGASRADAPGVSAHSYEALFELKAHASNLVFDDIVTLERLRGELVARLNHLVT
jgi:acetyl-CoA carboxylase carboxyltransferase component